MAMLRSVSSLLTVARRYQLGPTSFKSSLLTVSLPPLRLFHSEITGATANPVSLQMIDYALSLDLSQKLGNYNDAMGKLHEVQDLKLSSLFVRVAAMEAIVGLNLELGRDDTSLVLANKCLEILESGEFKSSGVDFDAAIAYGKAVKGLIELVLGNLESGTAALSYGEFLHATHNFQSAKDLYQKVIKRMIEKNEFFDIHAVVACNINTHLLAANCALGQLEAHMGNFGDAKETLKLTESSKKVPVIDT